MAWTTPGTAVAGDVLTAAFWNSNVRDNLNDHESRINDVGLVIVTPTSIAGTGVTSSNGKVSFASSTAVSVNGVFTSSYDNYMIVINARSNSNNNTLNMRFRSSGTDLSSALHNWAYLRLGSNATAYNINGASATEMMIGNLDSTGRTGISFDVFGPNTTETRKVLAVKGSAYQTGIGNLLIVSGGAECASSTAFDGFTIFPNAGSDVTGSLRVYGYQNS